MNTPVWQSTITISAMDLWLFKPGEITDISGKRGLERPPCSAAVDSNTAISSSSSKGYPHGEDKDSAMFTYKIQRKYPFEISVSNKIHRNTS